MENRNDEGRVPPDARGMGLRYNGIDYGLHFETRGHMWRQAR
ncbi:MAG: hypothetical protein PVH80_04985 [Anaerolineae bacterium]